jgi:hypothetical protein
MESRIIRSIYDNPDLIADLKADGFRGFCTVEKLWQQGMPSDTLEKGVYLALSFCPLPVFLEKSVGGWFKGKDPTEREEILKSNWVDPASIVYIGQTGSNLRRRIDLFMKFGQGKPVGHWGGRYIWQLKHFRNLMICWKATDCDSKQLERDLLAKFKRVHGRLPFANLRV